MEASNHTLFQGLITKLKQGHFSVSEVQDLDSATNALITSHYSEIINKVNFVWSLLDIYPDYWTAFGTIIQRSQHRYTKFLAYASMIRHICKQWHELPQNITNALSKHIAETIKDLLVVEGMEDLLNLLDDALVIILKYESNTLLKDFIASMEEEGTSMFVKKLFNNIKIIQKLTENAFYELNTDMPSNLFQEFQKNMKQLMRRTLLIVSDYISAHRQLVMPCLTFLKISMSKVPTFQFFNCSLVDKMMSFIREKQYGMELLSCFQALFQNKQVGSQQSRQDELKTANKLLVTLDALLGVENQWDGGFKFDIQSSSTEESVTPNERPSYPSRLLINCLRFFLVRYLSSISEANTEQGQLEVEFDSFNPLTFSKELVGYLKKLYWPLVRSLTNFIDKQIFDCPLKNEQSVLINLLDTARMLLILLVKLRLNFQQTLVILLNQIILKLTPFPSQFVRYYVSQHLILNDKYQFVEDDFQEFSQELQEVFGQLMEVIMKSTHLRQQYFKQIQEKLLQLQTSSNADRKRYCPSNKTPQHISRINIINRMSWSVVAAYCSSPLQLRDLHIASILKRFIEGVQIQANKDVRRCYSFNCKYLLLAYHPSFGIDGHIPQVVHAIINTNNDQATELSLQIIIKIINNPYYQHYDQFDLDQLQQCIHKLHKLETMQTSPKSLIDAYPAFLKVLIDMDRHKDGSNSLKVSQKLAQNILKDLLYDEICELQFYLHNNASHMSQYFERSLCLFEKVKRITEMLMSESEMCSMKKYLMKKMMLLLRRVIQGYEYKYYVFNEELKQIPNQDYNFQSTVIFIELYTSLITYDLKLINCIISNKLANSELEAQFIVKTVSALLKKFTDQQHYQCPEVINTLLQYFRWLFLTQHPERIIILNALLQQVFTICQLTLDRIGQPLIDQKMFLEKELVQKYLRFLNENNTQILVVQLQNIDKEDYLPKERQNYLQLFVDVVKALIQFTEKGTQFQMQKYMLRLFTKTFQLFFADWAKNTQFWQTIVSMFYQQIQLSKISGCSLSKNSNKPNDEVYYCVLFKKMQEKLCLTGGAEQNHHNLLQRIFNQKNVKEFGYCVQDYVNFLLRMLAKP